MRGERFLKASPKKLANCKSLINQKLRPPLETQVQVTIFEQFFSQYLTTDVNQQENKFKL